MLKRIYGKLWMKNGKSYFFDVYVLTCFSMKGIYFVVLLLLLSAALQAQVVPKNLVTIRKAGQDGVHTYRIPGITQTNKGTLIAVYDIRYKNSRDLPGNVDVGMSRSEDGGKTWESMKVIMDMGEPHDDNGVGDPAILFDPATRKIIVAALWSKGNRSIAGSGPGLSPDETGQFVISESSDDGLTWTTPLSITSQVKDPAWKLFFQGPGNGIVMKDGRLVFPAQYWDASHMPYSTIIYSDDHGRSWKRGTGAKSNTTESQLVETTPGILMLSMRDNRGKFRSIATTTDMGQTWKEHTTSYNTLADPVCMAGFIKANVKWKGGKKDILFFSNPASSRDRVNLTIKASTDLGESWPGDYQLLIDERASYGYSVMTKIDNKTIGLLYEGKGDLYFLRIPVKDISK
jgi:sialidase-1